MTDPTDFVRQGALLATSMVLMQNSNHADDSKLTEHRKHLQKVVADKHEDTMAKFGAILATGLLDQYYELRSSLVMGPGFSVREGVERATRRNYSLKMLSCDGKLRSTKPTSKAWAP